ncbi:hypothetical protein O181_037798 [Austropuccinia psidii MF-1]|uniref:Uncharacterized protein n=1 Tax=Austropuccinia psidii MF-1 TaxID=1389203 RepID=A0A9Q3HAG4_9BASI|nr:hypothetical protein [Austropuccinia psidii MF-1]
MWKKACETASKWIAEEKEYNKQRWDKLHMEPYFKEGNQVLVSTLSFDNLKGPKKMRDSLEAPSLSNEFSEAILPDRGGQIYLQEENPTPPDILEVEDSPGPVRKIIKARKLRINDKDQGQYLVRFKKQTADKDKLLAEDARPDGNLHFGRFRAYNRTEQSNQ